MQLFSRELEGKAQGEFLGGISPFEASHFFVPEIQRMPGKKSGTGFGVFGKDPGHPADQTGPKSERIDVEVAF